MKKIITGALLAMLFLTSSTTQTERTYEVRVRGQFYHCTKVETFYIKARTRALAEEEAHMAMMWRIRTKTITAKAVNR